MIAGGGKEEIVPGESGLTILSDLQTTGGLSLVYTLDGTGEIHFLKHTGNPAPAPPKNVSWQPSGSHPTIYWTANTDRDLAGYYVYRKAFGTSNYVLVAAVNASQTSWTDPNSSFCLSGCIGYNYYYVVAYDAASNVSDQSNTVSVPQNGNVSKRVDGGGGTISLISPPSYKLHDAYPNPFNPSTQIKFDLPEDGFVSLNVFDVLGRKVSELANGNYAAGYHTATWNASGISSGVYFARFTATDANGNARLNAVSKLLLAK